MSPRDAENNDNIKDNNTNNVLEGSEAFPLKATPEMCHHCFHVLIQELLSPNMWRRNGELPLATHCDAGPPSTKFADALPPSIECPLFVTWDKRRHHPNMQNQHQQAAEFALRGCIGTLSPRPLHTSIGEYALTSALKDRRFDPIAVNELPYLRVAVSLLVKYEQCDHCHDWTVGIHGIIIRFDHGGSEHSATYLPEVAQEQGWTQIEAVQSLIRKSGYRGDIGDDLVRTITCTRYQSSKHRTTYQEYVESIGGDDPLLLSQHQPRTLSPSCVNL